MPGKNHSARIAEIREILRAGVSRHTVDGVSVEYDFDVLRKELSELEEEDATSRHKRPRISTIDLSGF